MPLSDSEAKRLQDDVQILRNHVFGNGREGLDEIVRRNTAAIATIQTAGLRTNEKLDALKESIDSLRRERRDDQARREGAVDAFKWIKWGLGVLAAIVVIGGGLGLWQVSSQNAQVIQQLQRLPPLPE